MSAARLFALVFLLIASGFRTQAATTEFPFRFQKNLIWLTVDARGAKQPLHFILDSGAGKGVVDLDVAKQLGLELRGSETILGVDGKCRALHAGNFEGSLRGVSTPKAVLAMDLSAISKHLGTRVDGLLGADFFRGRIVQIDFPARKVRLIPTAEYSPARSEAIPLTRRNDAYCLPVRIDSSTTQWLRLDTGCSSALEWVPSRSDSRRKSIASIALATDRSYEARTAVEIGSERLSSVATGLHRHPFFAGEDGLLGNGILCRFCVTIDVDRSRMTLSR